MSAAGRLLGIARHPRAKAAVELVDAAEVTCAAGVAGDYRGALKGVPYNRQVTIMALPDWLDALRVIGRPVPWEERRVNLLVDCRLPRLPAARVRIGTVVFEITRECDPCSRMDAVAPGLRAALAPDWRGGVCTKVIAGGHIAVGDEIRIEEPCSSLSERSTISEAPSPISGASASSSART